MTKKSVPVYSANGIANKIRKMELSSQEASQVMACIKKLEIFPITKLDREGTIHKLRDSNVYVYRVNHRLRLMFGPLSDISELGAILYDLIDVEKQPYSKYLTRKVKEFSKKRSE